MADRITAALDYLDAHSTPIFLKQKQRSLGDVNGKYDVIDTFDLPFNIATDERLNLAGTSRTNLSRDKTIDQILDEDRQKIARSAHQRSKLTSAHKRNLCHSRPQTSLSSGSAMYSNEMRRPFFRSSQHAPSTSSSRTSTKKLAFTPPGVYIGPSDARDEVMEEIVNKPLTHSAAKGRKSPTPRTRTAASAPALGQQNRTILHSSRSVTSLSRSKTFHGRTKHSESDKFQDKPGPFATVKVSDAEMWVVSSSTPPSYFNGDIDIQTAGKEMSVTAKSNWEETANSVPHQEKKSPPRYERKLGAPPQFGPTQQWYSFAGGESNNHRPVLTAFADEIGDEYYSIESRVSEKVSALLEGSPGIRIGVNGHIVANSMKVNKKQEEMEENSFSDGNESKEETKTSDLKRKKYVDKSSEKSESDNQGSQNHSDSENDEKKISVCDGDDDEDKQFSLLRYLGIARGDNPYVVESSSETTSSTDVASILNNFRFKNKHKNGNVIDDNEDSIWKVLEGASPSLWIDKDRWKRVQFAAEMKKQMALKIEDNSGPLSWQDQLLLQNGKVLEARMNSAEKNKQMNHNGRTPVIFHKFIDYSNLPANFVHLTGNGYKTHSSVASVDKDLDVSEPNKGYATTISAIPKTSKSNVDRSEFLPNEVFQPRPFTSQSPRKTTRRKNDVAKFSSFDNLNKNPISSYQQLKPDERPQLATKDDPKLDDVSQEELEAIRIEAAYNMKMTGGAGEESAKISKHLEIERPSTGSNDTLETIPTSIKHNEKSVTLNSLPVKPGGTLATVDIRPNKPRSSVPVSSLNLSEIDEAYNVVNGPNPSPLQSFKPQILNKMEESKKSSDAILRNEGRDPPLNTPKTLLTNYYSKDGSAPCSPKHPEYHPSSSISSRFFAEPSSARSKRLSKCASFLSKSSNLSARTSPNNSLPHQKQNRPADGFVGSPLTSKPTSRQQNKYPGGISKTTKIGKLSSPGSIIPHGNTYADLITKSGYIQISHPIHISPQHTRAISTVNSSGNKMYDSYMRELSAKTRNCPGDAEQSSKSGALVGKRLGGSSSKLIPAYLRRSKQQTSVSLANKAKGMNDSFDSLGSRRLGLAMTNERTREFNNYNNNTLDFVGSIGLGLQGDQLRLNLDKNIHVMYRDMGIPKKNSKPSSASLTRQNSKTFGSEKNNSVRSEKRDSRSAGQRSDSTRSRPISAKSGKRLQILEDISNSSAIVTDVTAPIQVPKIHEDHPVSLKIDVGKLNTDESLKQIRNTRYVDDKNKELHAMIDQSHSHTPQTTSSKVLNLEVAESGTQWSPHGPKPPTHDLDKPPSKDLVSAEDISTKREEGVLEKQNEIKSEDQEERKNEQPTKFIVNDAIFDESNRENEEVKILVTTEETIDRNNLNLKISTADPLSAMQSRNVSDSQLSQSGPDAEQVDAESVTADDEAIRGVTKVTVNIGVSGESTTP